jgi:hypothetical protein
MHPGKTPAHLPAWANNAAAKALIDAILQSPPATYVRKENIFGPADERFSASTPSGKLFCRLRRLHREWHERQLRALDVQFHVSGIWSDQASRELHGVEDAQALIVRLLSERGEERRAA